MAVAAAAILLLLCSATSSGAAVSVEVDAGRQLQPVDGLGVNANVHSWRNGELRPAVDALVGMGVSTWRVIIDRCDWEATNDNADPSRPDAGYYSRVYSEGKMRDLWDTIAYIKRNPGQQVMVNCMGGVPEWMGGSRIAPEQEDEWVEMIASLVDHATRVKGLKIDLLGPMNEPDWDGNEGPKVEPEQYVRLLGKLARRLDALGLGDVGFVGPDTASASRGASDYVPAMAADPFVASRVARLGIHSYDGSVGGVGEAIAASPQPDKRWWVTEFSPWCAGCDNGQPNPSDWTFAATMAQRLLGHLEQGASGAQVYDGWDGFYEHHNAVGYWGLLAYNAETGGYSPRKSFYAMKQFMGFIPRGAVRLASQSSSGELAVGGFWHAASRRLTLVLGNSSASRQSVEGRVRGVAASRLAVVRTDAASNAENAGEVGFAGESFRLDVPPNSLVTLTGTADPSAGFQVSGTGTWEARYGAPRMRLDARRTSEGTSGSVEIAYANGAELRGDATCVSVDGGTAYVIARVVASSDRRWTVGDYIAVGIADRGGAGDTGNFSPGLAGEPACAPHDDARPVLPVAGDFVVRGG